MLLAHFEFKFISPPETKMDHSNYLSIRTHDPTKNNAGRYIPDSGRDIDLDDPSLARLQSAVEEVTELNRILAGDQERATIGIQQVKALVERNLELTYQLTLLLQKESQAQYYAYHDDLTGLPNRRLLRDRLNQAVAQAQRQHKHVVLLLLDLDGFKSLNDRLGHSAGDELLEQVAKRLIDCVRVADTVCRYGGDEFVVMLPEFDGGDTATAVTQKIRTTLDAPYTIEGEMVSLKASIGVAVYPDDGSTYHALIKKADAAMYRLKATKTPGNPTAPKSRVGS